MFAGKGTASDTEHKRFDGRQLQVDQNCNRFSKHRASSQSKELPYRDDIVG